MMVVMMGHVLLYYNVCGAGKAGPLAGGFGRIGLPAKALILALILSLISSLPRH
jgi:hypothetical protein